MEESKLIIFFLLTLLISLAGCQNTQYLLNPTMTDTSTPYSSSASYKISDFSPVSWKAYQNGTPNTLISFNVVGCNSNINTNPAQNCIRLGNDGSTNKKMCVFQTIGSIPAGTYQFSYTIVPYLNGNADNQVITGNVLSSTGTSLLSSPVTSSFNGVASYQKSVTLTLASAQTNIKVTICRTDTITNKWSSAVTNVKLTLTSCTNKLMQDSSTKCVPNSIIDANPNCYKFSVDTSNVYSCYACDSTSTAPYKLAVSATTWACGQVLVPDVKYYKATTVVGSSGFLLIVPATCQAGKTQSSSSYLAIPKYSDSTKDMTGRACRADFSLIDVWDVKTVNNQQVYVGAHCSSGNLVDLVDSAQTKGCILTSQPEYTEQCKTYSYNPTTLKYTCTACNDLYSKYKVNKQSGTVWQCILTTTYNTLDANCDVFDTSNVCATCVSGFTPASVSVGGASAVTKCLSDSSQILPLCTSYTQTTPTSTYYCASNGCSSGTTITVGSSSDNGLACTTYPKFPQGNFQGACTYYARPKLVSAGGLTYLKCSQCTTQGINPDYCKFSTTDTRCTGDPTTALYGSDATANSLPVCAIDGFVSKCTAYTSIDGSKKLGLCTTCDASVPSVALKDASTSICLAKLIPNCLYHNLDGTCSQCKTDTTYQTVTLVSSGTTSACMPTNSQAYDTNCKNYKYSSGVFTCEECNGGFDRYKVQKTSEVWMCFSTSASSALDPNCDVYQSTSPCICSKCKTDYQTAAVEVTGASAILKCLNKNTELIPSCTKYTQATSTSTYYCKTGSCSSATQIQIDTFASTNPNALACTSSTVFPAGNFQGGCNYYQRPTATSTVLKCSSCVSGTGDYCEIATGDTTCTGAPGTSTYGSPANVMGTVTCAIGGFIPYCSDYTSIDSNKMLGKCRLCDSTSPYPVIADLTATQTKCIASSIVNCKYYNSDGTCQQCNPGTSGSTVNLIESVSGKGCILTSNANYDVNCLTYKYTTEFECASCQGGFTRKLVEINNAAGVYKCLNDATQTLPYCSRYTQASIGSQYYCKPGSCTQSTEILIGTNPTAKACTKFTLFPIGTVQGACRYYERPTLLSTDLRCSDCVEGDGMFCRLGLGSDVCSGAPGTDTYGVAVSVKGVVKCANSGVVDGCDDYNQISNGVVKTCTKCNPATPYLVSKTQSTQLCLSSLIPGCKYYQQQSKCSQCSSGAPSQNSQTTCPSTATKIIPFCQRLVTVNGLPQCLTCTQGYLLDQTLKKCIVHVEYCSNYQNGVCVKCIESHTLVKSYCVKKVSNCQVYENGGCKVCEQGMVVKNGGCEKGVGNFVCLDNQFKDYQGLCVTGKDTNCARFTSPSGLCIKCKEGFEFNDRLQCKTITVACPQDTVNIKYVLSNGVCLQIDSNCLQHNVDGSCPVCKDGFYSYNGKCVAYQSSPPTPQSYFITQISYSDSNGMYFINPNGTRYYISGIWQGLQVFIDNKNNFYLTQNNSRKYLTGTLKNMIANKDQNGKWYAINSQGRRVYDDENNNGVGNLKGSNFRGS